MRSLILLIFHTYMCGPLTVVTVIWQVFFTRKILSASIESYQKISLSQLYFHEQLVMSNFNIDITPHTFHIFLVSYPVNFLIIQICCKCNKMNWNKIVRKHVFDRPAAIVVGGTRRNLRNRQITI